MKGKVGARTVQIDEEAVKLKLQCVDLLFDCPRNHQSPACPFCQVREQDVVDRVKWLKGMDIAELRQLVAAHNECCSETGNSDAGKHDDKEVAR